VLFASTADGAQTATLRRLVGAQAAWTGEGGEVIFARAPVSMGQEAHVTQAGDYRLFAGWRSDSFFFDAGAFNDFQFVGTGFFADKDVCSIALEAPNAALGATGATGGDSARPVGADAEWCGRELGAGGAPPNRPS
jgi:hypothetical protein